MPRHNHLSAKHLSLFVMGITRVIKGKYPNIMHADIYKKINLDSYPFKGFEALLAGWLQVEPQLISILT